MVSWPRKVESNLSGGPPFGIFRQHHGCCVHSQTGRYSFACSELTGSASDAVRRVSSDLYGPSVHYGIFNRGDRFLGLPESSD